MSENESPDGRERDREIYAMREAGATWKEIEGRYGLTRQQARYCYQRGKREERRKERRAH